MPPPSGQPERLFSRPVKVKLPTYVSSPMRKPRRLVMLQPDQVRSPHATMLQPQAICQNRPLCHIYYAFEDSRSM